MATGCKMLEIIGSRSRAGGHIETGANRPETARNGLISGDCSAGMVTYQGAKSPLKTANNAL